LNTNGAPIPEQKEEKCLECKKDLTMKISVILLIVFFNNFSCSAQANFFQDNIVDTFHADLNKDGIMDKIIVYKNLDNPLGFKQEHFKLPVKIFFGIHKNKYKIWYENDLLIFDNNQTCVSEGYSNIIIKKKYFTIESQTCYDYNVLVTSYMTFKIVKNKIFLYKYSEEYFDKYNHERKIPSKNLAEKDFGKKEFDEISINSLVK